MLSHLVARSRQRRAFKARKQAISNPPRVAHILEKERMLPDPRRLERLTITPDRNHQLIIRKIKHPPLLDLLLLLLFALLPRLAGMPIRRQRHTLRGVINRLFDRDGAVLEIHIVRPALEEIDFGAPAPHGFERGAELEGPDGCAGEERREGEVRPGRDDDGLVFGFVEGAGDGEAGPA